MERERGGEPANAAAGNDDAVVGQTGTHDATPSPPILYDRTRPPSTSNKA